MPKCGPLDCLFSELPQISSTSAKELLSGVMEKDAGHDDQAMVQELSDLAEPAIAANSCKAGCERGIVRAASQGLLQGRARLKGRPWHPTLQMSLTALR